MLEQSFPFPGKLGAVGSVREAEEGGGPHQPAARDPRRDAQGARVRRRAGVPARRGPDRGRATASCSAACAPRARAATRRARPGSTTRCGRSPSSRRPSFDGRLFAELEATETARLNSLLSRPPDTRDRPARAARGPPGRRHARRDRGLGRGPAGRRCCSPARRGSGRAAEGRVADSEALPELMLGVGYDAGERPRRDGGDEPLEVRARGHAAAELRQERRGGGRRPAPARRGPRRWSARPRTWRGPTSARPGSASATRSAWPRSTATSLLPQAVASLRLAETWHRAGQGSFADLVEAGTLWYSFQLALARAGADREKYLARLESLAERPLTADPPAAGAAPAADRRRGRLARGARPPGVRAGGAGRGGRLAARRDRRCSSPIRARAEALAAGRGRRCRRRCRAGPGGRARRRGDPRAAAQPRGPRGAALGARVARAVRPGRRARRRRAPLRHGDGVADERRRGGDGRGRRRASPSRACWRSRARSSRRTCAPRAPTSTARGATRSPRRGDSTGRSLCAHRAAALLGELRELQEQRVAGRARRATSRGRGRSPT